MPTGYTADVQDGKITEFTDFALLCARAFGALIHMRDSDMKAKLPDRIRPDTRYHDEALRKANDRLKMLRGLTPEQCELEAGRAYSVQLEAHEDYRARQRLQRERYEAMLAKVKEWSPPSPDHEGLKKFMCEQLQESIRFDCGGSSLPKPKPIKAAEWLAQEIARCDRDIEYHGKERDAEIERAAGRDKWLRDLRDSHR